MRVRQSGIGNLALLALLAVPTAAAQPPTVAPLTFEVASVKIATSGSSQGGCHGIDFSTRTGPDEAPPPLGRCVITGSRLSHLIGIAFGVSMQDLSTGPDWIQ